MLKESETLCANFDHYFLRRYQWRYHLMIVDNHLFDCYGFFLQAQRANEKLLHSYELLELPHDPALYQTVLADLKAHTQLTIEFRDTHHLVHPGTNIVHDLEHGHARPTRYHSDPD
ncbi:hypothetical protein RA086_10205 [Lactiplantibacillus sp. WILCCON 0030]|uniref:Uncharacterized protein n=1 Tax=Lactiplantibacillus brownii TaxID=3069269 RepID=A0ABU1AAU3_9LACO|nr:hypothetical protein [Lactiplantibacillus brownii]MDQ7937981.1 hypothetical protein [Lactiplantibacillus brownii]